jgi:flavin reductase (DIM6/NTAB) family NADH-FMN oxidoreductase RutF
MLQEISIDSIELDPFATIGKDTMLITATSAKGWNTMTASWGGMGHLWNRNVMFIFVRKSRYTHTFLEEGSRFTCSFFPEEQKRALGYLGNHSGRDGDKVKASGLNAEALDDGCVSFKEANLVFACTKIAESEMVPEAFHLPDDIVRDIYRDGDWHTLYIGSIDKVYVQC